MTKSVTSALVGIALKEDRIENLDQRLSETEERLRQATEGIAPRIPSGRSVARLNDLREALRAQASQAPQAEEAP